ncbi:formate C-acetyltransferase/glycerol dehydratase family glycyl radical enzyme [Vibrio vulnificus]|nr:formate C-acetyltransferase/glycerol dehydratase family glycyl radical enzyme [Vibrio vulnificus]EKO5187339.1 formate C-acetyltransferase/glycerol dehydratase family glycyl radical enzyme [Vibrio vulnificus]ELH7804209.1 formate C-acetyltransferase/glycerol dehydratase family glycyl radical enzyme [Vibrio vulnificus]MCU8259423.1 formate C-acetyltransferase/glycerol dehydratase family glycyl radical enzyme [Vibrio vulnificus]MCU8421795.1 formate C-acetyltransferase/glycerol dehydratase family 
MENFQADKETLFELKTIAHTDAIGTEAFDKVYGLGYEVGHADWSPFPRVNRLRQTFLERSYDIDVERLRLVTEAYRDNETMPRILQCALAFQNILLNSTLHIYDEDLILGEIAAPAKASPIYPEFSVDWIIDEILNSPFEERPNDQFYIRNEQERAEILELCAYWKGKSANEFITANLDDDQKKGSHMGEKVFQTNNYHFAGIGHFAMDFNKLMTLGYKGVLEQAQQAFAVLSKQDPDYGDKRDYYTATIIALEAAIKYIARYAQLAEDMAFAETDETRKQELQAMSANCHQIASGVPQTFWQAAQLFNFAVTMTQIEGNGHSISYGRMDQWMLPFYAKDRAENGVAKEFVLEVLEVLYIKMNNPTKLKDKGTVKVRNGRGFGGESLTIGGVDQQGNDATNDLTMLMLEASVHTRMMNPWVCVRLHDKTPYELKVKTIECIRAGYGHPKLFNDSPAIKAMIDKGVTLEEARDYAVVGCVEPTIPGKEHGWLDAGYVNTVKMMEMVINGGRILSGPNAGIQLGPDTGSLETYQSFEEVLESVDKQFAYWCDQLCSCLNITDKMHRMIKPTPYISAFFEGCIESGKDMTYGGVKYNGTAPQAAGIATCADSLASIKKLMFDDKKYTGKELLDAVKDNWDGHQKLYALVNSSKIPHYGNDIDEADELFKFMFECYCRHIKGRQNPRGGKFSPGVYTVNANVGMGLYTNASLDGRKNGEPISDNMGPVHTAGGSHDISGPTAVINSVTKVDHSLATNGTLLNLRFPEDAVSGVEGRDILLSFVDEYMGKQGMHVQFNIMSSEKMRAAQKNPDLYRDMLVRVAGYSAYFVELGKPLQDDLIQRTELRF